jgi:hypothetical protein
MLDMKSRSLLFGLILMALIGCGQKKKIAALTGKITYNGRAVSVGAVYFHGENDDVAMANIARDGAFTATDVPLGKVRVSLQVRDPGVYAKDLKGFGGDASAKDENSPVTSVPEKYADPKTSGLEYSITTKTTFLEIKLE